MREGGSGDRLRPSTLSHPAHATRNFIWSVCSCALTLVYKLCCVFNSRSAVLVMSSKGSNRSVKRVMMMPEAVSSPYLGGWGGGEGEG